MVEKKKPKHQTIHDSKQATCQCDSWKTATIIISILFVISLFINGYLFTTQIESIEELETDTTSKTVQPNNNIDSDTTYMKEGKAVIVEFSDFQCPYCARAVPTIHEIQEAYGDDVEIIFKHFPIPSHSNAQKAAEATECARDQGKFWELHDILYENQRTLDTISLKKYAAEIGLDKTTFNTCLDNGEKTALVKSNFDEGKAKGVTGTPTFFVNGEKVVGAQPFSNFKRLIDPVLA